MNRIGLAYTSDKIRKLIVGISFVGLVIYCMMNFKWNLPHADFRPFKKGADIKTQKELEEEAMGAVQITHWKLEHIENGEILVLGEDYPGGHPVRLIDERT